MGVVFIGAQCISCSRTGSAHEATNFKYECSLCQLRREQQKIKESTQQSLWIRFLYWIVK
jgi:hypothetical protein